MPSPTRIPFLNTSIDNCSMNDVIVRVDRAIASRTSLRIFFVNGLKIHEIDHNPAVAKAMGEFELVLADGISVVWASRYLGQPIKERLAGIDVFRALLTHAEARNYGVYFLGAKQALLDDMLRVVRSEWPKLRVVGSRNGYFNADDNPAIINDINHSAADLLFLGFGSPKKETWAREFRSALRVPVIQGVGGSFDVLSGAIRRAPEWIQKAGLEWFFRLSQEPRRLFPRYLITNTYFIYLVLSRWFSRLWKSSRPSPPRGTDQS